MRANRIENSLGRPVLTGQTGPCTLHRDYHLFTLRPRRVGERLASLARGEIGHAPARRPERRADPTAGAASAFDDPSDPAAGPRALVVVLGRFAEKRIAHRGSLFGGCDTLS